MNKFAAGHKKSKSARFLHTPDSGGIDGKRKQESSPGNMENKGKRKQGSFVGNMRNKGSGNRNFMSEIRKSWVKASGFPLPMERKWKESGKALERKKK